MKRHNWIFSLAVGLILLLPASPMLAGGGHGGGHGGHGGGHGGVVVVGGGWGWGWGVGWGWPGWYGYYPGYAGYYAPYGPRRWAAIDTDISPEEAYVYLDGRYIGTADDFDGHPDYLYLGPGHYKIEFRLPGYESVTKEVDAQPGMYVDFKDNLRKIPGQKQYGSYDPPKLEGEIQRFFAKRKGGNVATDPYAPQGEGGYPNPNPGPGAYPPQAAPAPQPQGNEWRGSHATVTQVRTRLQLTVQPPDAAVYVDNRFVGTAEEVNSLERGLAVSPGKHTVTVSRPGMREKTAEVEVGEGEMGKLEISLSK
jgi:PEGA domain-containing protein